MNSNSKSGQVANVIKSYQGRSIRIREDKYVCLTDMAVAAGKRVMDWNRLKGTEDLKLALATITGITTELLVVVTTNSDGTASTWGHPKLAIQFAQWCNPIFAIQVSSWIDELMTTGSVTITPKTPLELAREQVRLHEILEHQALIIASLEDDNHRQAEVIDELFDYSSIIRIAKYNSISETNFNWRVLKRICQNSKLEIKKAPCKTYGEKNLYPHEAWRLAYPHHKLPETTTLVINR